MLCWDAGAWSNPGSSDEVERWRGRVCLGWQNCLLFFKGADNSAGSVFAVCSEATSRGVAGGPDSCILLLG